MGGKAKNAKELWPMKFKDGIAEKDREVIVWGSTTEEVQAEYERILGVHNKSKTKH